MNELLLHFLPLEDSSLEPMRTFLLNKLAKFSSFRLIDPELIESSDPFSLSILLSSSFDIKEFKCFLRDREQINSKVVTPSQKASSLKLMCLIELTSQEECQKFSKAVRDFKIWLLLKNEAIFKTIPKENKFGFNPVMDMGQHQFHPLSLKNFYSLMHQLAKSFFSVNKMYKQLNERLGLTYYEYIEAYFHIVKERLEAGVPVYEFINEEGFLISHASFTPLTLKIKFINKVT